EEQEALRAIRTTLALPGRCEPRSGGQQGGIEFAIVLDQQPAAVSCVRLVSETGRGEVQEACTLGRSEPAGGHAACRRAGERVAQAEGQVSISVALVEDR